MKIRVSNFYSDSHTSAFEYVLDGVEPVTDVDDMWDALFEFTGDGHGADNPDVTALYEITVLEADDPALVGLTQEICGN